MKIYHGTLDLARARGAGGAARAAPAGARRGSPAGVMAWHLALLFASARRETFLPADASWCGGQVALGGHRAGSVRFDWLGVSARVSVKDATWVTVIATTAAPTTGTRLRAYTSDQGFGLYPLVSFWVSPHAANETLLFAVDNSSYGRTLTLENMLENPDATTIHGFRTDGHFVPDLHPLPPNRNIEFIGDSITAASNLVRPAGAPPCRGGQFQMDWTKSYAALLCHRFGASCSTIAVGGKCMMKECGGLQMPDFYNSALISDAPRDTYKFGASGWVPQAVFIDLGTNDERVLHSMKKQHPNGSTVFVRETVAFLHSIRARYSGGKEPWVNMSFFLAAGPIRNFTARASRAVPIAVDQAISEGLDATFVDLTGACSIARHHAPDNVDKCDGCSAHPGIEGHFEMAQLAHPVLAGHMGWGDVVS